jgi:hypothetical protein
VGEHARRNLADAQNVFKKVIVRAGALPQQQVPRVAEREVPELPDEEPSVAPEDEMAEPPEPIGPSPTPPPRFPSRDARQGQRDVGVSTFPAVVVRHRRPSFDELDQVHTTVGRRPPPDRLARLAVSSGRRLLVVDGEEIDLDPRSARRPGGPSTSRRSGG